MEKYIIIKQSVCANKYAALEITCDELTMAMAMAVVGKVGFWVAGVGGGPGTGHLSNGDGDDPNSIFSSPQLNCQ